MPWLMLGLVVADGLENLLSSAVGSHSLALATGGPGGSGLLPIALALSSVAKFALLALLAKVILKPV